jgi:hypothetical protein
MRSLRLPFMAVIAATALCACSSGSSSSTLSDDASIVSLSVNSSAVALSDGAFAITLDDATTEAEIAIVLPAGASASINGGSGTSMKIEDLVYGDTKATIIVTAENGSATKTYVLTITRSLPLKVSLVSPVNSSVKVEAQPSFSWNASSGAVSWLIYIVKGTSVSDGATAEYAGANNYKPDALDANSTYAWRVVPVDSSGKAISEGASDTWIFGTGSIPAAPSLSIAANGLHPLLSWPASDGAASYSVHRNGSSAAVWKGSALSWADPNPVAGQTNTYTVMASNGFGSSEASNEASISIDDGGQVAITID